MASDPPSSTPPPPPPPAPSQRVWRAMCPQCGAPVDFRSAASAFAVCGYCRSQVLRDGEALRRIGQSAELMADGSALRLGASGVLDGLAFTLVGRRQLRTADSVWSEWHAWFDGGAQGRPRSGWLSEDNGRHVFSFDAPLQGPVPEAQTLKVGQPLRLDGRTWTVASRVVARLAAAEGELPAQPRQSGGFVVADLRSTAGEVGTLEYAGTGRDPSWSVGRAVALADLSMRGLDDAAGAVGLAGRSLACPSCGQPLTLALQTTRSVVCGQCRAVVDVSTLGPDAAASAQGLEHFAQQAGTVEPAIALGSVGRLAVPRSGRPGAAPAAALPWQVVGYVERCTLPADGDDEQYFWREYLLFNRIEGFAFLVDSDEGWSLVRPLTGVPTPAGSGLQLDGVAYRFGSRYESRITQVLGEFYWVLRAGERTRHTDYLGSGLAMRRRLNREETGAPGGDAEVTWSAGETLDARAVQQAFGVPGVATGGGLRLDTGTRNIELSQIRLSPNVTVSPLVLFALLAVVIVVLARCSSSERCDDVRQAFGADSAEARQCERSGGGAPRSGGGSFGGYSGGGGHK